MSRIAATRSGASGFAVLPGLDLGATGSLAAMARASAPVGDTDTRGMALVDLFDCFLGMAVDIRG